jgi:hypothetical protein
LHLDHDLAQFLSKILNPAVVLANNIRYRLAETALSAHSFCRSGEFIRKSNGRTHDANYRLN